ncbi:MAG: GH3 auxin-responsive promoter family protein [Cyclobacteriaceae bacterium]
MGFRSILSKPLAAYLVGRQKQWMQKPFETQNNVFKHLISTAKNTAFGKEHNFANIQTYEDFKVNVPIKDYEGLSGYVDRIIKGEDSVLWPGKPLYFAKTSGTTSGTKFIPISKDSMPYHIAAARDALLNYIHETGKAAFFDGKLMFITGSPTLEKKGGIFYGRLSGITNHHVPGILKTNQLPSYTTNVIEDFEEKIERIVDETAHQNMSLISGIPPWVQMYFDRITARTGKKVGEVFPDFSLFVFGGVNFAPYKSKLYESIGRHVDSVETYPASEGFVAFQDRQGDESMLMLLNSGIFYEFIPTETYFDEKPTRLSIEEVELDRNYAVVINSNAGLWGYSLGDTVKFVSKNPYKLLVTGRIKHFISAFGEHVIGEEVEKAMKITCSKFPEVEIVEFSVAPQVTPDEGLPLHEWYVSFERAPDDLPAFELELDKNLQQLNSYYEDLIQGKVLRPLKVIHLPADAFRSYMKSKGKLGGQNKVPRLSNDRDIADALRQYI